MECLAYVATVSNSILFLSDIEKFVLKATVWMLPPESPSMLVLSYCASLVSSYLSFCYNILSTEGICFWETN